jgi:hypothetical protein
MQTNSQTEKAPPGSVQPDGSAFLEAHGWRNSGHWDNWFDPTNGWNCSLADAVKEQKSRKPTISLLGKNSA